MTLFVFFFMTVFFCHADAVTAADKPDVISRFTGEHIKLKITWFGILAGHAEISLEETEYKGGRAFKFRGVVKSARWFKKIYYVEDAVESFIDPGTLQPLCIRVDYREGKKYRRKSEYVFDYIQKKIFSSEDPSGTPGLNGNIMEMFGAFSLVRSMDFSGGSNEISAVVSDGRKFYRVSAARTGLETVDSILGRKECIVVQPSHIRMDLFGTRQTPENIFVYLTNDKKRIPVIIRGDIRIGSLLVELEDYEHKN